VNRDIKIACGLICLISVLSGEKLNIDTAIKQLSNAEYHEREDASHFLLSNATLDEMKALQNHDDPEVRYRINKVIQSMQSGITVDTPAEIVALVHEFQEAEPSRKADILIDLEKKKAYLQIFALSQRLGDDLVYKTIQKKIEGLVTTAVRHYLDQDDTEQALKILDFTEPNVENCRLWAFIVNKEGLGGEKLAKLLEKPNQTDKSKARVLALYRSGNKLEEAKAWAKTIEHESYLAGHALIDGDLEQFITWGKKQFETVLPDPDYLSSVMLRAKGNIQTLDDYETLYTDNAKIGETERLHSILQLAASGSLKAGFKLMTKAEQKNQFSYLNGRAQFKTLFDLYDIEYGKPLPEKWITKQNQANQNGLWFNPNSPETRTVISILKELGDYDSLHELFLPQWERIKQEEENQYEAFYQLAQLCSKKSALKLIETLSEDELAEVEQALKGSDEISSYYYTISQKTFPEKSTIEHIDIVLAVTNADIKTRLQEEEVKQLIKAVEADRSNEKAGQMLMQYLFFDEWENAAKHALTYSNEGQQNHTGLNLHKCAILKKGGLEQEEQELLKKLHNQSLDAPAHYLNAAALYKTMELHEEALYFIERGLNLTNPDEQNFFHWARFLQLGQELYAKGGQHHLAALCGEVLILKRLSNISASSMLTDSFATGNNFSELANLRYKTDLYWIEHIAKNGNDAAARQLANRVADEWSAHGVLADDFYPLLRKLNYKDILERSLNEGFDHYLALTADYPMAYNHMNAAAWLASRAVMRLPEAEKLIEKGLAEEPRNHAFLDTRAEVYFANGDRKSAVEYSLRAWQDSLLPNDDPIIKQQYYHFKNDPLPEK